MSVINQGLSDRRVSDTNVIGLLSAVTFFGAASDLMVKKAWSNTATVLLLSGVFQLSIYVATRMRHAVNNEPKAILSPKVAIAAAVLGAGLAYANSSGPLKNICYINGAYTKC